MAFAVDTTDRQVIPRFRNSLSAQVSGESAPFRSAASRGPTDLGSAAFQLRQAEWRTTRTVPFAADFLGAAIVLGREAEAVEAAEFIMSASAVPGPLFAVAKRVLGQAEVQPPSESTPDVIEAQAWKRVAMLRPRVRSYPRNGFAWLDLAEAYATLGQLDASHRAITIALGLLPDHRLVLRSASHFYLHVGEADRALWLLRRSDATKRDPWLMAAEIAVSSAAGKSSSTLAIGRKLASTDRYDPFHLSELRSAVGTETSRAGDRKLGRRLLEDSLNHPTDNAVAQVEWMAKNRQLVLGELGRDELDVSAEGRAFESYRKQEWLGAFAEATTWFSEQPLSPSPSAFACHMAVLIDDKFDEVLRMLDLSCKSNPDSWFIQNDVAFTSVVLGDFRRARDTLTRLDEETGDRHRDGVITATRGLLAMREGRVEQGRALYQLSLDTLAAPRLKPVRAAAAAFWAREEARLDSETSRETLDLARKLAQQVQALDLPVLHDQAARLLEGGERRRANRGIEQAASSADEGRG